MTASNNKRVLVCGGAGYIGSHMCKRLARAGYLPLTFDNLSTGHRWAVKWGPLVVGDLLDSAALTEVFSRYPVSAVMHFAASSLVAESVREPGTYFRNNVTGTLNLLHAMRAAGVDRLVFSSTAAVYGEPAYTPIDEAHPTRPISPYGWSKLFAERVIAEHCRAHGLRAVSLRYFNAAGADDDAEIGESHEPETHLIPNVIRAALDPEAPPVTIFGDDYATPDGTCVRDYIHVADLCDAHLRSLALLAEQDGFLALNLGSGQGHSVTDVVRHCRRLCGGRPPAEIRPRRDGDPPALLADARLAARRLGFVPTRGIDEILSTALAWHQARRALAGADPRLPVA